MARHPAYQKGGFHAHREVSMLHTLTQAINYLRMEWRPVCVHAIRTRLHGYAANPWTQNRSLINTYIYIFPHNLC